MRNFMERPIAVLTVVLLVTGCGRGTTEPPVAAPTPTSHRPADSAHNAPTETVLTGQVEDSLRVAGNGAENTSSHSSSDTVASAETPAGPGGPASATPTPFNLFQPPKVDLPVVKQSETREESEPVRLIGFVEVDNMKALLAFDGKIRAMEAGDMYKNVEVVAIKPPQVTLQRGRQRWITTLFDQPVVHQPSSSRLGSGSGPQVTIGQSAYSGSRRHGAPLGNTGGGGLFGPAGLFPGTGQSIGSPGDGRTSSGDLEPGVLGVPGLPGIPGDSNAGGLPGIPGVPALPGLPDMADPAGPRQQ